LSIYAGLYGHPTKNKPQWYVGYLTFRDGKTMLPKASLTGGGQIYKKDYTGNFRPIVVLHVGPTVNLLGGGFLPQHMPGLTSLYANPNGSNTGT
jgi:hypothetical protein